MDGSTPVEKQISSTPNTTKLECEALCRAENECCSFAWSPTQRSCDLSSECEPTGPSTGDFIVCEKDYIRNVTPSVIAPNVSHTPGSEVATQATNSSLTIEVYCCNSDGSGTDISFYHDDTVRTCGNGVSCVDICVTSQNITVVPSGD